MYAKVFLAFALIGSVYGQSVTVSSTRPSFGFQNALNNVAGSVKAGISLFNTTGQTGAKMVNDGAVGMAGAGKAAVNTVGSLKSTGLHGAVSGFKQGSDIASNMIGIIPGMDRIAKLGGSVAKTGADAVNMMGQTGINLATALETGKLELLSGFAGAGAGLASNGLSMGANMATSGVDTGLRMANGAVGTIGNMVDNAVNYANQASNKMSSMASSTADRMSVSAPSIPSSLSLSGVVDNARASTAANGVAVTGAAIPTQGQSNVQVQVVA